MRKIFLPLIAVLIMTPSTADCMNSRRFDKKSVRGSKGARRFHCHDNRFRRSKQQKKYRKGQLLVSLMNFKRQKVEKAEQQIKKRIRREKYIKITVKKNFLTRVIDEVMRIITFACDEEQRMKKLGLLKMGPCVAGRPLFKGLMMVLIMGFLAAPVLCQQVDSSSIANFNSNTGEDPYIVYFAGELFDHKHLTGNSLLCGKIEEESGYKYGCNSPQDLDIGKGCDALCIRNKDFEALLQSDLAVFSFDGTDVDSGTVAEYFAAITLDYPKITFRTDFREVGEGCGSSMNPMLYGYPRTENLELHSIGIYKEVGGDLEKFLTNIARGVVNALDSVLEQESQLRSYDDVYSAYSHFIEMSGGGLAELFPDDVLHDILVSKINKGVYTLDNATIPAQRTCLQLQDDIGMSTLAIFSVGTNGVMLLGLVGCGMCLLHPEHRKNATTTFQRGRILSDAGSEHQSPGSVFSSDDWV